jgi:hypothetical protein
MARPNHQARPQANRPTITVGRRQLTPPDITPGPQEKLRERNKQAQENQELKRQLAAEQAAHEQTKFRHSIDDTVLLNAQALKLDKAGLTSLDRTVDHAIQDHLKSGKPLKAFDPFAVISAWKARKGLALPPAPKNGNPLDSALPPPAQAGRVPPNDAAARDAALRESAERGARQRAAILQDRAAYERRLRELGLTLPEAGMPGNGSGIGL